MSAGEGHELAIAELVAKQLVFRLAPSCDRIEIAGSIRRRAKRVHDIEIVVEPKIKRGITRTLPGHLFPEVGDVDCLEEKVQHLLSEGLLLQHPNDPKDGPRYKKLWSPHYQIQIDLFIVRPPGQWGPALAIRTGPAGFSTMLVTKLRGNRMRCHELRVIDFNDNEVPCDSEADFFRLCGVAYLAPRDRGM